MPNIKAVYRYIDEIRRSKFSYSQCLLTISVGQEVHENEKFETTVDLINGSFRSCIMLIDDTLQRHTMVLDRAETADEMYQTALDEGDKWLVRNEKYFSRLTNLTKILRWDQWLNHPHYSSNQTLIEGTLHTDPAYRRVFDDTIQEFLKRYCNRLHHTVYFDFERAYKLCFDYLIEECTAMILWPELGCHFEVYPSKRNVAMDETHRRFVLPTWPDLLHAVAIKFKNRKQLKPQQFHLLADVQAGMEL